MQLCVHRPLHAACASPQCEETDGCAAGRRPRGLAAADRCVCVLVRPTAPPQPPLPGPAGAHAGGAAERRLPGAGGPGGVRHRRVLRQGGAGLWPHQARRRHQGDHRQDAARSDGQRAVPAPLPRRRRAQGVRGFVPGGGVSVWFGVRRRSKTASARPPQAAWTAHLECVPPALLVLI